MKPFYQKFLKDTVLISLVNLSLMINGLILLPILTKILGSASYGIWIQTLAVLSLIGGVSGSGSLAFVRFFAGENDETKLSKGFFSVLIYLFILNFFITIGLITFSSHLSEFFAGSTSIIFLIAIILPFYVINNFIFMFFRTVRKIKVYSVTYLFQNYFQILLIVIFIFQGLGISGVLLGMFISYIITEFIILMIIMRYVGIKKPHLKDFAKIKKYLHFDIPYIPYNISGWVTNLSDRFIISSILGITAAGIYSASYSVGSLISSFIYPINMILVPALSELYDKNQINEVKSLLEIMLRYYLLIAIPAAVGISVLAKPLMEILTTEEIAMASTSIVPLVAFSMVFLGCQAIINQPNNLVKKTKIVAIAYMVAATLNLTFNLFLVPYLGIFAAALTTLLSAIVVTFLTLNTSFKHIKFDLNFKFIIKSLFSSFLMGIIILYFNPTNPISIFIWILIGTSIYFITLLLINGINRVELREFRNYLNSLL